MIRGNEGVIVASATLLPRQVVPSHPSPSPVAEGVQERLVLDTLVQDLDKRCDEPANGLPGHIAVISLWAVCLEVLCRINRSQFCVLTQSSTLNPQSYP